MLRAILISRDQDAVRTMRRALESVSIQVNETPNAIQAAEALQKQKFDAVIIDVDDIAEGASIIPKLRAGKSNQRSIVFAVTRQTTMKSAFEMGANFVLEKPISLERAARSLRAAHGLIMRERRRYFRAPVSIPAQVSYGEVRNAEVSINNISEGGLSLKLQRTPALVGGVSVKFVLPGNSKTIEVRGEFVASNRNSDVGVKFGPLSAAVKTELDSWLNQQIESAPPPMSGLNGLSGLNRR